MRAVLVWLVSVVAAFALGHYGGARVRDEIVSRSGVDIGGGVSADRLAAATARADSAEARVLELEALLADAETRAAAAPRLTALTLTPRINGKSLDAQTGLRTNELTRIQLDVSPDSVGDVFCRVAASQVWLASGVAPKGPPIAYRPAGFDVVSFRSIVRQGDRLVFGQTRVACGPGVPEGRPMPGVAPQEGETVFEFPPMSFPIR